MSGLSHLEFLTCRNAHFFENSLDGLNRLRRLEMARVDLEKFSSFKQFTQLQVLVISHPRNCDHLERLDLRECFNLRGLQIENFSSLKAIENLSLGLLVLKIKGSLNKTNMKEFAETLGRLNELRVLDLDYNDMDEFDINWLANTSSLRQLSLHSCKLKNFNLNKNSAGTIECKAEKSQAVVPKGLENLKELNLSSNSFVDIDPNKLSNMPCLEKLNLSYNQLQTVQKEIFRNFTVLKELDLSENKIRSLPDGVFAGLDNLKTVSFCFNKLTRLTAETFSGITSTYISVDVSWNPFKFLVNNLENVRFIRNDSAPDPESCDTYLVDMYIRFQNSLKEED